MTRGKYTKLLRSNTNDSNSRTWTVGINRYTQWKPASAVRTPIFFIMHSLKHNSTVHSFNDYTLVEFGNLTQRKLLYYKTWIIWTSHISFRKQYYSR